MSPAITDIEQLKDRPEVARLLAWNAAAVTGAKFDRNELTIWVDRIALREACHDPEERSAAAVQRPGRPHLRGLVSRASRASRSSTTCSRFRNKKYLRLKVRLSGGDANVDSLMPIWPGANFFEREVFDLFGVRFDEHPNLARIMMPENWEGHPLRKDYPVEGYR